MFCFVYLKQQFAESERESRRANSVLGEFSLQLATHKRQQCKILREQQLILREFFSAVSNIFATAVRRARERLISGFFAAVGNTRVYCFFYLQLQCAAKRERETVKPAARIFGDSFLQLATHACVMFLNRSSQSGRVGWKLILISAFVGEVGNAHKCVLFHLQLQSKIAKERGTCSSPLRGFFAAVGNTHVSLSFTMQESESRREREFPLALVCCCFGYAPYCSLAMRRCCVYVCVCVSCVSRLCSASAFLCVRSNRSTEPTRTTRRKKLNTHRQDKSKTRGQR